MKRAIFLYTVGRSGNHAVINWIQQQFEGKSTHYNHTFNGWSDGELIPMHGYKNGATIVDNGSTDELEIYSVEDMRPTDWSTYSIGNFKQLTQVERLDVVWHIRDPLNWLASSIMKDGHGAKPHVIQKNEMGYIGKRIDILKEQVWDHDDGEIFPSIKQHIKPNIVSNFNSWFLSKEYREDLANQLDIPFTDAGLQDVANFGGGSTFDGHKFDKKAQDMDVLNRWQAAVNDPRFWISFGMCSDWVMQYSYKYFNYRPPIEQICGDLMYPWT